MIYNFIPSSPLLNNCFTYTYYPDPGNGNRISKEIYFMAEWLKSLKISIAGAKLSHLVQQDKIWDHGSMVEHVRTVVVLLKKAFHRSNAEIIKKCMSVNAYKRLKNEIEQSATMYKTLTENDLETISIIDVIPGKNGRQDKFTASLKFKQVPDAEKWFFVRHGDWWLLDEMTVHKSYKHLI